MVAARVVLKIPIREHDSVSSLPASKHAQGDERHGQPCLQTYWFVDPSRCRPLPLLSNRRPLTHEGARVGSTFLQSPPAARPPLISLPPNQDTFSNVPKAEAPAIRQQRVAILMVAYWYCLLLQFDGRGGKTWVMQGEVSTLPTFFCGPDFSTSAVFFAHGRQ